MPRRAAALLAAAATCAAEGGAPPAAADLRRARQKVPRDTFRGGALASAGAVLNARLAATPGVTAAACERMGDGALRAALRTLLAARSPDLDAVYRQAADARALRHAAAAGWEREWAATAASPHAAAARDAKCHDAAMLWAHHVPAAAKPGLLAHGNLTLPLLPATPARRFTEADLPSRAGDAAVSAYVRATACAFCHGDPSPPRPLAPPEAAAPAWPPASVPEWPTQFASQWYGWVGNKTCHSAACSPNMTGHFKYDFPLNRMREDITGLGSREVNRRMYWFGTPQPDGAALPPGVAAGNVYRADFDLRTCVVQPMPGYTVTRPDGFANGGRIAPGQLHYVGRERVPEAGRWADHWLFDDGQFNLTIWNDIETHYPVKSDDANDASWWADVKVGQPAADTWSDYDFTQCKPPGAVDTLTADSHGRRLHRQFLI